MSDIREQEGNKAKRVGELDCDCATILKRRPVLWPGELSTG